MSEVIRISDCQELVPTKKYPHAKWPYEKFNPVQSRLMETFSGDSNIAIAAATSAGKTVAAEMYLAYEIRQRGGKGIYVGPLKALAKEKEQDWTGDHHHFSDVNTAIVTGDFRLTEKRIKEMDAADLIVMTPEMLASRCRNHKSEKSTFLQNVGTVIFDECFSEDSIVITERGELCLGDIIDSECPPRVLSFNHRAGKTEFRDCVGFQKKLMKKRWLTLYYNGGETQVTENQLVFVNGRYKYAHTICPGDIVEVVSGGEEQNRFDRGREAGSFGVTSRRRLSSIDRTISDSSTVQMQSVIEARATRFVEVREVKEVGWHPSCNVTERRLRKFCEAIYNSFISRTEGFVSVDISERKKNCQSSVVAGNIQSFGDGVLVYGRREYGEKNSVGEFTHRRIFGSGMRDFEGLACETVGLPGYTGEVQDVLSDQVLQGGKREVHRNCTSLYYSFDAIQTSDSKSSGELSVLWKIVRDYEAGKIQLAQLDLLWRKELLARTEAVLLRLKEESICCDLEVEFNNNFFVKLPGSDSAVLCHNSHLLTVPSRGDHIEVALMKLVDINPDVRIVLLSATMPNVDEICGWVSQLTGRDTYYLESDYRPCPLNIHYETYYDGDKSYEAKELQKVGTACGIAEYYSDDKFLIFVHTKRTGNLMISNLQRYGVNAEFHNADLALKDRLKLEERFKHGDLRVIVATSTLAWGLNLPARRVIVTGIHRGLDRVANYDVQQMIGRAGRPQYDPVGDAYILVPESTKRETIIELRKKSIIKSTLLDYVGKEDNPHYKTLAFHVVSEIHRGNIKTKEAFHEWFRHSLAYYQDQDFDDEIIDKTINLLIQYKAIRMEDDEYQCTPIGMIASMFYYSPFDVSDLRRNFHFLFEQKREEDDFATSMALGNLDTWRYGVVNRYEREQMAGYAMKVKKMYGEGAFYEPAIKAGFAYYNMLKGLHNMPAFQNMQNGLLVDLDRTMQVVGAIDAMSSKWNRKDYFRILRMRLRYGVEAELVELCQIPNVGQVRAKRLKSVGIHKVGDFVGFNAKSLATIMKVSEKVAGESLAAAQDIHLKDSIDV